MRRYGGVAVEAKSANMEAHYRQQIVLCEQLLDCMVRERETLVDLDVDRLWSITEEKQHILRSIEGMQSRAGQPCLRSSSATDFFVDSSKPKVSARIS